MKKTDLVAILASSAILAVPAAMPLAAVRHRGENTSLDGGPAMDGADNQSEAVIGHGNGRPGRGDWPIGSLARAVPAHQLCECTFLARS